MRAFLILVVLIGTLLAIDAAAFGGRYRQAAWRELVYQSDQLDYQISYWLKKVWR